MKVYYHEGSDWNRTPPLLPTESNMLALSFNNWDDYGKSTTLNAVFYYDKKSIFEFSLKLLIEGEKNSPQKMNIMRQQGWNGFFPIPNTNYVSVPSDIEFYDALISMLGIQEAKDVLLLIKDAGYLFNVIGDEKAKKLTSDSYFSDSPLREAGARKSFSDGWKAFIDKASNIEDFTLFIPDRDMEGVNEIRFRFNSETLPYDINVLIGPNGIGKSYTLKNLVENWLGVEARSHPNLDKSYNKSFDKSPNISKLILISYSPFEDFALNLSNTELKDKTAYKYFGFRRNKLSSTGKEQSPISRNLPARDAVESIFKAFEDDSALSFLSTWTSKIKTIWEVLQPALGFEDIAVATNSISDLPPVNKYLIEVENGKQYFKLTSESYLKLKKINIELEGDEKIIDITQGVIFLKDGKRIELSSGQRLFVYMVINIVGQIRAESLVVVDEPELFLHPTFEVEFIALLKKVLTAFNSKAILATHSLAIAREIPANCMHVYRKSEMGVEIDHPPFETFGGDMQRISSYVFGDNRLTKPFAQWIENALQEAGSPEKLMAKLKGELNEETTIRILNSGEPNGR